MIFHFPLPSFNFFFNSFQFLSLSLSDVGVEVWKEARLLGWLLPLIFTVGGGEERREQRRRRHLENSSRLQIFHWEEEEEEEGKEEETEADVIMLINALSLPSSLPPPSHLISYTHIALQHPKAHKSFQYFFLLLLKFACSSSLKYFFVLRRPLIFKKNL